MWRSYSCFKTLDPILEEKNCMVLFEDDVYGWCAWGWHGQGQTVHNNNPEQWVNCLNSCTSEFFSK